MKAEDQKIIFLNSYLPRTGHNFASEVIKIFSNHQVLAHNKSETRLSTLLDSYIQIRNRNFFETDRNFMDKIFIEDLRKKITSQSENKFIMIKDTSFVGVDHLPVFFPEDIHLLLIRDPKTVILSLLKGMNLKKKTIKNRVKQLGFPLGFYPYTYSKKINKLIFNVLPDFKKHFVIKYEDLVKKDEALLTELKKKFNCQKSISQIKAEIDDIPVINSSFYKEVKAKKVWDAKPKTENFKPLDRKIANYFVEQGILLGSKPLRKKLNYI